MRALPNTIYKGSVAYETGSAGDPATLSVKPANTANQVIIDAVHWGYGDLGVQATTTLGIYDSAGSAQETVTIRIDEERSINYPDNMMVLEPGYEFRVTMPGDLLSTGVPHAVCFYREVEPGSVQSPWTRGFVDEGVEVDAVIQLDADPDQYWSIGAIHATYSNVASVTDNLDIQFDGSSQAVLPTDGRGKDFYVFPDGELTSGLGEQVKVVFEGLAGRTSAMWVFYR